MTTQSRQDQGSINPGSPAQSGGLQVLAPNLTARLPRRPQPPPAKFDYSSWQERSPHPQSGLNKRPSDITSCWLQNSPGLPTSDRKMPGHAGPSGQGCPARGTVHTHTSSKAEASEQEGPPLPPLPDSPAPPPLPSWWGVPSASPRPSANPMEPRPRPACGRTPARPGHPTTHIASRAPDTKP